jgi:TolB-like protein/Tfp pilus assembly protein PilF
MAEGGVEGASDAVSQPPGASAAAGSRTVFLSYASPDAEVANQICQFLESHGVSCWMAPRDVKPGSVYADAIVRAINEASALVLVLSGAAMASEHVSREVERAASKRKQIVAFRVDAARLSAELEYFLSRSQWIDAPALGMPAALAKLADAVGQRSAPSSQVNPVFGTGEASGRSTINRTVGNASVAKRVVGAAAIVIGVAIALTLAIHFWPSKHRDEQAPAVAAISDKSIAVLPFVDMSEKKDQEYFGDGMAEEITDLLSKIPGLRVIGRTSAFQFKGKTGDLRKIGSTLGARFVVEGSVRRTADRIRVSAQLISTDDGGHAWSDTYDREFRDALKVQDDIAAKLVRALQVQVGAADLPPRPVFRDPRAYELYLRGRSARDRYDKDGVEQAVAYYEEATRLDPSFAPAAEALAVAYFSSVSTGLGQADANFQRARKQIEVVLARQPDNANMFAILARINAIALDWSAADGYLKRALLIAPSSGSVLQDAAFIAGARGQMGEAQSLVSRALVQDPLNPALNFDKGDYLARDGHLPEAEAQLRHTLQISPTHVWARYTLGQVLLARGQLVAALDTFEQVPLAYAKLVGRTAVYYAMHRKAASDQAMQQLEADWGSREPYEVAQGHAYRDELDQALQWLKRAGTQKDTWVSECTGDPPFAKFANDVRYLTWLRSVRVGL